MPRQPPRHQSTATRSDIEGGDRAVSDVLSHGLLFGIVVVAVVATFAAGMPTVYEQIGQSESQVVGNALESVGADIDAVIAGEKAHTCAEIPLFGRALYPADHPTTLKLTVENGSGEYTHQMSIRPLLYDGGRMTLVSGAVFDRGAVERTAPIITSSEHTTVDIYSIQASDGLSTMTGTSAFLRFERGGSTITEYPTVDNITLQVVMEDAPRENGRAWEHVLENRGFRIVDQNSSKVIATASTSAVTIRDTEVVASEEDTCP